MTQKPNNTHKNTPPPGDFSFLKNEMWSRSCQDGYDTVTKLELWSWLDQVKTTSFMLSSHPNLELISKNLDDDSHSGASWACMMRNLEYIAKNGWDAYVKLNNQ